MRPGSGHGDVHRRSEAAALGARLAFGPTVVFGTYVVLHVHLTPGGGVLGSALAGLDHLHNAGVGDYVAWILLGLIVVGGVLAVG